MLKLRDKVESNFYYSTTWWVLTFYTAVDFMCSIIGKLIDVKADNDGTREKNNVEDRLYHYFFSWKSWLQFNEYV